MSKLKKKCILGSFILIAAGFILIMTGYAMTGFHSDKLSAHGHHKWYQTFDTGADFWIGISF